MAWLMTQRAVVNGEISAEEACREKYRLSGRDVCLDNAANDDETLPAGLRSLLDRSLRLYERVSRLEQMVITRVVN
jgi:regulator of CtrA degradation